MSNPECPETDFSNTISILRLGKPTSPFQVLRCLNCPKPTTLKTVVDCAGLSKRAVQDAMAGFSAKGLVESFASTPSGRGRPENIHQLTEEGIAFSGALIAAEEILSSNLET